MSNEEVVYFTSQALYLILILSMPTVLAATVIGVLVSLLQALTQVQEQTLGFVVKLVAVVVTMFLTAQWMSSELYSFGLMTFEKLTTIR